MNKLLKILIGAVLLLFVYLGGTALYKSMSNAEDSPTQMVADGDEYDIFDETEEDDDFFEESTEEKDPEIKEDGTPSSDEAAGSGIDYSEIDEALEEPIKEKAKPVTSTKTSTKETTKKVSKPVKSTPKPVQKPKTSPSSNGKYLVIAGSYLVKENAEKMKTRLAKLGYDKAEIVVFDERKYHTVCASKSNDYDTAVRQSNALKRKGIDSYVHTRQ
jgi:cell division protein FtsN